MWQYTVLVLPTVFATIVSALLGAYSLQYMRRYGRTPVLAAFLAVNVGLMLWTGFSALKLLNADHGVKLLLYRLLYFGVSPLGPFALLFALAYTDREQWLSRSVVVGLLGVPVVFWILLFTNPAHLAIEGTHFVHPNGIEVLRVDVGPAHLLLQFFYNALLSLLALGIVGYEAVRLGRSYIPQAALIGIGIAAPLLFVLLSSFGVPPFDPEGVNLVPTSAAVTSTALGVAIFRFRLLDLPPIAYTTAMEESPDGVLVLGSDGRIVHANERGTGLLSSLGGRVGGQISDVFPEIDLSERQNDAVHIESDDDAPTYLSVRTQPLERQGRQVGWVIVLRDVTELQRQKRTIEEQNETLTLLNQIICHDIRNDMSVVLGNAHLTEELVDDDAVEERLATIVRRSEHAVELTEAVRTLMTTMLDEEDVTKPVSLAPALRHEVDGVRSDEGVVVDVPEAFPDVDVVADDMLGAVFRNLLTNAVRHNRAATREVVVSVEVREADVVVRIADNGPGVPDDQKHEIFGRGEKGLDSPGTGVGLYLVDTLVHGYGGEVRVEDNQPRGAVFVVRLLRA